MRTGGWVLVLATGLALIVPATPAFGDERVRVRGSRFEEPSVTVAVGETVTWEYADGTGQDHTLTFIGGTDHHPACGPVAKLDCFEEGDPPITETFPTDGTYRYYCKIHSPDGTSGMTGVIVVVAAAATTTTTAAPSTTTTSAPTTTTTRAPTTTTRVLATSSTTGSSTTTTTAAGETSTTVTPNDPPDFDPDDPDGDGPAAPDAEAASATDESGGSGAVPLIVALLLMVSAGGGLLLWRLRPSG